MPYAHNGEVSLYYEEYGPTDGPALLMIEGYTAQLVGWEMGFVRKLNEKGIRTILMDNRDVGLSSQLGTPEQTGKMYSLADMASDVAAVATAAGAERFHIMGESMGGMITQQVLTDHADRVKSAVIMFTVPGYEAQWMATPESANSGSSEGLDYAETRDEAIEIFVSRERACHIGSNYVFNEDWARELGGITYDRCYRPDGWRRQNSAIADFRIDPNKLASFGKPTAVIHGRRDPFFSSKAGEYIADLLNGELHLYPGMAHEVPEPLWDEFAGIIARTVEAGER
ncbi:alpha/beta hydrolase [Bifidobacterium margollesii]|uniref:Alpha/beta hydrolase n=1 Tax=Bifidobacterium margollesii TaxID=2020964 RepID=A0A2N5JD34_9BIFI|nr:alpha/beta hydrolase [Bifidobacterium margollesii]PLS32124.1 alpha/beta hydrolase [Bifidobacterium margollesii]